MKIQYKFYLYFVVTVLLSPVLFTEISLVYSAGHIIDILLVSLILLVYFGLYLSIRKDFLLPYANLQDWVLGFKSNQSMRLDEAHDTTFQPVATAINHLIDRKSVV